MISPTLRRGLRDSYGSWKTICSPRRKSGRRLRPSVVTAWPSKVTVPAASGSRPTAARASVDLPQPDSPTSPTISPRATVRSTPSTARRRWPRRPYSTATPDRVRGPVSTHAQSARSGSGGQASRCCVGDPFGIRPGRSRTTGGRTRSAGGTGSRRHRAERRRAAADRHQRGAARLRMRQRVEQPPGVRVPRPGQQLRGRPGLGQPPAYIT